MNKNYKLIAKRFMKSNYNINAVGCRNVFIDELTEIIKIIFESSPFSLTKNLNFLYSHSQDTINMAKCQASKECQWYDEHHCNCWEPDINKSDIWCNIMRKNRIESLIKRNYPEYIEWRKKVFERDNFICQRCNQIGGELNAHHKKSYKNNIEQRINIDNGITLCIKCHKLYHGSKSHV